MDGSLGLFENEDDCLYSSRQSIVLIRFSIKDPVWSAYLAGEAQHWSCFIKSYLL